MLPQGYTRVEWIESTGEQYIDTGIVSNQDTAVKCEIEVTSIASGNLGIFGARSANATQGAWALWNINGAIRYDYNNKAYSTGVPTVGNHTISIDSNVANVDGTVIEAEYGAFSSGCNVLIGTVNNIGTADSRMAPIRIKSFEITNENKTHDLIPSISPSMIASLWDETAKRETNTFGAFVAGNAVIPTKLSGLTQVEFGDDVAFEWNASENANEYRITRDGVQIAAVYGDVKSYTDTGILGEHTYTVTPYNGTQAGTGASITIRNLLDAPANLNAALDDCTVTLTWDAVSGADGYKVYRDGAVIASVSEVSFSDTLTPPASVAYAVAAYAGTVVSGLSEAVIVENWEGVLLTLITDRTAADVAEAKRLRDKLLAGEALTDEETARYFAGLRGAYNASDMNRVGAAVRYVAGRLNAEGYGAYVSPKTDWQMEDIVRQSDWNKYLDEVRHLRRKLTLMRTSPQIADGMYSGLKSYAEANAIEQILVDLDIAITCIIRNYIFSGEVFAGEV